MKAVADLLALEAGEVVSIAGCGGKTTLMWGLARYYRNQRVLATTSTKIGWPPRDKYDTITDAKDIARLCPPTALKAGIHLAGTLYDEQAHIKSLPISDLGALCPNFDKIFIEADGSRLLPVKGWDKHEPVIPPFTSVTVGVATIWAEGRNIGENTVHRPHIFCRLTGASMGKTLTLEHMAAATAHPDGLMARAAGRRILLINRLDDAVALKQARAFVKLLPTSFLNELESVVGACLERGSATLLWKKDH